MPWYFPLVAVTLFLPSVAARGADPSAADSAVVEVRLPATATLTIDTHATGQRGPVRTFVTPPLAAGQTFLYELVATWEENGSTRRVVRQAVVKAGQRTRVDFTAAQTAKVDPPIFKAPKTRTFLFTYAATVKDLPPGKEARIWLPFPANSAEQTVSLAAKELPAKETIAKEKQFGNRILYVQAKANEDGQIPLKLTFKVTRKEVRTDSDPRHFFKPAPQEKLARFLQADKMVPVGGKGLTLLKNRKLPHDQFASAKILYDMVNDHMKYSKEGIGWGRGDADWACDSRFGNCTDFHSLFISLARARQIPAKFDIGFPIPPQRGAGTVGGYHCWAWFLPDGTGWVPVDISEANRHPTLREYYFANLTEDRVMFSSGRDLTLVPAQQGPALNFFVYPYVEVDGQPYTTEKVQRTFSYEDVK